MGNSYIYNKVEKLVKKFKTRDPFEILEEMNVIVGETDRYEKLKNMEKTRRPDQMDPIALKTRLGKTIFDIEHLEFYFDERPMIKDFTYHVVRHDRIGIVGPNGVGKSTFMNILDGTYEPTRGTIGKGETGSYCSLQTRTARVR